MLLPLNSFNCDKLNHKSKINYSYYDNDCDCDCDWDDVYDFQSLNESATPQGAKKGAPPCTPSANARVPCRRIPMPDGSARHCHCDCRVAVAVRQLRHIPFHSIPFLCCNLFVPPPSTPPHALLPFCHLSWSLPAPGHPGFINNDVIGYEAGRDWIEAETTTTTMGAHAAYLFKVLWPGQKGCRSPSLSLPHRHKEAIESDF